MMWLHPCLKPTLCRNYSFKNRPSLASGSVCASYKERLHNHRNEWLVFSYLLLHTLSINNQLLKWKQCAMNSKLNFENLFWITALSPQNGSNPLVTTSFQLNYLIKYNLFLENIRLSSTLQTPSPPPPPPPPP